MHRALQLHDIIYTIFCHISEPSTYSHQMHEDDVIEHYSRWTRSGAMLVEPRNNVGQMTLAALASTCRLFQEPALDILWADLYFPYPLIRCLPEWRDRWRSVGLSQQRFSLDATDTTRTMPTSCLPGIGKFCRNMSH